MDRNLPSTQPPLAPSEPPVPESTAQLPSGKVGIGDTGVFAGDWTSYERDGAWHFPVGFVGTLVDWWNGWAVFTCTRPVAEAIVCQQEDLRESERRRLRESGLSGDELGENVDEMIPPMYWDGDEIVLDESVQYGPDEGITRIAPDQDGRYNVNGWRWTWQPVNPAHCDTVVGTKPPTG